MIWRIRINLVYRVFLLYLVTSPLLGHSQNGVNFVQNWSPSAIQADGMDSAPQNWDIVQADNGLMYVANLGVLLVYDGTKWGAVQQTNALYARALAKSRLGRIYVAANYEVGVIESDSLGRDIYVSLSPYLPDNALKEEIPVDVISMGDSIAFIFEGFVLIWEEKARKFMHTTSLGPIEAALYHDEQLLTWVEKKGLYTVSADSFPSFLNPQTALPFPLDVRSILPASPNQYLLVTNRSGIFIYEKGNLEIFSTELLQNFPEITLYHGKVLNDGNIALSTHQQGIIILSPSGDIVYQIDRRAGLQINSVIQVFQDRTGALWAALDAGVSRIQYPNELQSWGLDEGLEGTVLSILKQDTYILAGTTTGLYIAKKENPWETHLRFRKLPQIREAWDILSYQDQILIASSSGIFHLQLPGLLERISPKKYFRELHISTRHPDYIYVGSASGLSFLKRIEGQWVYLPDEVNLGHPLNTIAEGVSGKVWGAGDDKASLVSFQANFPTIASVFKASSAKKKPPVFSIEVIELNGKVYFGTEKGIYSFDEEKEAFQLETRNFSPSLSDSSEAYAIYHDQNKVWISSNSKRNGWIDVSKGDSSEFIYQPYAPVSTYAWCFYTDSNGVNWIGTEGGLFKTDFSQEALPNFDFATLIRAVKVNEDSILYGGTYDRDFSWDAGGDNSPPKARIPSHIQEINFSFATPYYQSGEALAYSYFLQGFEQDWSEWRKTTTKSYTGLWEGNYTFYVKAKNIYGHESEATSYSFRILPPWYRSAWAYLAYTLLFLGFLYALVQAVTRRQKKKLEAKEQELEKERQTAERLRTVDRLKDEFLANTSHELRTPLNGIIGIAEGLKEGGTHATQQEEAESLSLIISSGRRLASLVDDILDLSKMRNQDLQLSLKALDVYSLVDVVLRLNQPLTKGKSLELQNKVGQDLPPILADENRVQQIFQNLVDNGIKFTDEGAIAVSANLSETEGFMDIQVSDTGIGIPKEKQEQVFNEFVQIDGTTQREYGGMGLGLSITRKLVELHRGKIWVASQKDKGSTIHFTLPLAPEGFQNPAEKSLSHARANREPEATAPLVPAERASASSPSMSTTDLFRILVVDDEVVNQHVLQNHLKGQRAEIVTAMNGQEALAYIDKQHFDLIILDIMMPKMSGYEVCEQIRAKYLPSELPVIMVTAKNQVTDLVQGLELGANDYLAKPFSRSEFLARVKTHLNLHQIHATTAKFIPTEFLKSLGYQAITEVVLGDHVEKEVSVMFADIRDYTTLAETMNPTENFKFVNAFTKRMGPMIEQNRGFVNQYLGDCIMSIFPDQVEDGLNAAINMQQMLATYNAERSQKSRVPIRLGIGLHTGPLIFGIIGDDRHLEAASIADSVNTSARMESLSKHFGASIILSEKSLSKLQSPEQYNHRFLGQVQVKGKQEILGIYEFFDGDPVDQALLKFESRSIFEKGLNKFFKREFLAAIQDFAEVLHKNPSDGPASYFLRKAKSYAKNGVEMDWSGVEMMGVK
ncbi:MAG: response regulator [Bacteroidota bacterium]